jgi:hypothetical protein
MLDGYGSMDMARWIWLEGYIRNIALFALLWKQGDGNIGLCALVPYKRTLKAGAVLGFSNKFINIFLQ